jgi:hypothetical protein
MLAIPPDTGRANLRRDSAERGQRRSAIGAPGAAIEDNDGGTVFENVFAGNDAPFGTREFEIRKRVALLESASQCAAFLQVRGQCVVEFARART